MKDDVSNRFSFLLLYTSKKNYNIKSWGLYVEGRGLKRGSSYFKVQGNYAADFNEAGIQPQLVPNVHLLTAAVCCSEKSHLARPHCVVKRAMARPVACTPPCKACTPPWLLPPVAPPGQQKQWGVSCMHTAGAVHKTGSLGGGSLVRGLCCLWAAEAARGWGGWSTCCSPALHPGCTDEEHSSAAHLGCRVPYEGAESRGTAGTGIGHLPILAKYMMGGISLGAEGGSSWGSQLGAGIRCPLLVGGQTH